MRIRADGAAADRGPKDADAAVIAVANQRKGRIRRQRNAIWAIEFGVRASAFSKALRATSYCADSEGTGGEVDLADQVVAAVAH